jgi:hypothetical protein
MLRVVLVVLLASLLYVSGEPERVLYPFKQLTAEVVHLDGAGNRHVHGSMCNRRPGATAHMRALCACRYQLKGLKPSTGYEVRVSHPASVGPT